MGEGMHADNAAGVFEEMTAEDVADVMEGMVTRGEGSGSGSGMMGSGKRPKPMGGSGSGKPPMSGSGKAPPKRENNRRDFAHQRAKLAMKRKVNEMMERRQANNDEHSARRQHGDGSTIAAKARAAMRAAKRQQMAPGKMARRMAERRGDESQAWNRRMKMPHPQAMRRQMMKRRQQKSE